jgi:hypothetical protein
MNPFQFGISLIAIIVVVLSGCCHKKSNPCPALEKVYSEFLHHEIGEEIRFVNNLGKEVAFIVRSKDIM